MYQFINSFDHKISLSRAIQLDCGDSEGYTNSLPKRATFASSETMGAYVKIDHYLDEWYLYRKLSQSEIEDLKDKDPDLFCVHCEDRLIENSLKGCDFYGGCQNEKLS